MCLPDLSEGVEGLDHDGLEEEGAGVVTGGEVDLVLPVQRTESGQV